MVLLRTVMLALGTGLAALASVHARPSSPTVVLAIAVIAAAFFAVEMLPLHIEWSGQAYSLSLSELPLVVALLCWPAMYLIFARVVGGGAALLMHRKQPMEKLAYNVAMQYLEVTLALAIYLWLPHDWSTSPLRAAPAVLIATGLSTSAAMLFVCLAIRTTVGRVDPTVVHSFARSGTAGVFINVSLALVGVGIIRSSPVFALPVVAILIGFGTVYRAYVSLRRRHASLETLYEFTRGLEHSETTDGRIRDVLIRVRDMLRAGRAGVLLDRGDDASTIRWVDEGGNLHSETFVASTDDWPFALVVSSESVITIERASRDAGHREFLTRRGVRDAILAPLHLDGMVSGVLFVEDRSGDVATFTEDDGKLFETIATHVSNVLDNSRLLDRLRHESRHDTLTGLVNRHYFRQQLSTELEARDANFALLIADLDRFKEINDTLGHHHGDLLIMEVASRITAAAPFGSTVARLGGDEFAMLVPSASAEEAIAVARMLHDAVAAPCVLDGLAVDVAASFGIALAPSHGSEENVLLKRADLAMYAAKSSGTGVELYDAVRDDYSPRRLALATELRGAIERDELLLHYQPQATVDGAVTGVEALVRWRHPQFGAVGPDEFVPLAEQSGAIVPLTYWVLSRALSQLALWHEQGHALTMSINISMRNLLDAAIVDTVASELERCRVIPRMVTLEITESHIMSDPSRTLPILHRLAKLGVRLSIDDFGTGYSSLSYLRQFPVNEIKIDKSFVGHADAQDNRVIVRAIVGIASSLGVETVAEGVEDEKTADWVRAMGCTHYQGWFLGRPMEADELVDWMTERFNGDGADVVSLRPPSAALESVRALPSQRTQGAGVEGPRPGRSRRGGR